MRLLGVHAPSQLRPLPVVHRVGCAMTEDLPDRRSRFYFTHNVRDFPVPRARWEWDGEAFSYITVEIASRWSDPILGVTWELPSALSRRLARWANAGRPIWGDRPLPVVTVVLVVWLAVFLTAVLSR